PGGEWPSYGHDPANTRTQPAEHELGPAAAPGLTAAWTFSTASAGDSSSAFDSTPVVAGGCVFAASTGGYVYALDAATGRKVWQSHVAVATAGLGGTFVGAPALRGHTVIYLVDAQDAPYAIAFDRSTGAVVWRSDPVVAKAGYYTNASAIVANGLLFFGYSAPEGDPHGVGGFGLLDADSGAIVKVTPTIPQSDQDKGYAGGGLWSTPAYDPGTKYAYIGAGNPSSKTMEHPNTNAILKIDLDRSRATFGEIVASYKGNPDQYDQTLQQASQSPACAASDNPSVPYPLDDPACGQLDLDFGAAPNLFTTSAGRLLIGDLQKSGVYHAADAATMKGAWTAQIGASCQACNAASTTAAPGAILGVSTPGGVMNALGRDDGTVLWRTPVGDGVHYQSTSVADGVAYTLDGNGFLDAYDVSSGAQLLHRPMAQDTGSPMTQLISSGVAIAAHTAYVAAADASAGWIIAYRG
ncbi:MAG: outer membrane protein assembly factor BamB family protein, partial [Solirubrobacteraceae bacterium]